MKQFNLDEYLRLKEEGKEPKIVTRDGMSVRIVCTDVEDEKYPVLALYLHNGVEDSLFCTASGWYTTEQEDPHDLFFADPKPTYRPYKDAGECIKEVLKHGGWVKNKADTIHFLFITGVFGTNVHFGNGCISAFQDVLNYDVWADDGSPCGVKED